MAEQILIIEDEPAIADNIAYALSTEGYRVCCRADGRMGLAALAEETIDLVVLDVGLPGGSGFDIAGQIRKKSDIPIIFVTARDSEIDRVVGLEIGGDDYLVKPFSPRELAARVRAVLRRTGTKARLPQTDCVGAVSPFTIDAPRHRITFRGESLELSCYEFRLLQLLLANPGRVYSRDQLMAQVWEEPDMSLERTVHTISKPPARNCGPLLRAKSGLSPIGESAMP